jgi:hypothetical protein
MSQPPQLTPLKPLGKKKLFDGLAPWQVALSLLPLALMFFAGAIGGGIGAAAMVANVKVAKSRLGSGPKVLAMVGITLAAVVAVLLVAGLVYNALNG